MALPARHANQDGVWASVLGPEVVEYFRDHPRPPDPAFDAWLHGREQRLVNELRGTITARQPVGVDEHGRVHWQPGTLTVHASGALDGLHQGAFDAVDGRVWERWSRQPG